MRPHKYTKTALEFKLQRTVVRTTAITKVLKYLFSSGSVVAIAWFINLSIQSLAGSETNATINVVFDILRNKSVATFVPWAIGIGGVLYGLIERIFRIRKVARLTNRNKFLELQIDPGRQTSNLNVAGNARGEDK